MMFAPNAHDAPNAVPGRTDSIHTENIDTANNRSFAVQLCRNSAITQPASHREERLPRPMSRISRHIARRMSRPLRRCRAAANAGIAYSAGVASPQCIRSLSLFLNGLQGTNVWCMGRWRQLCNGFINSSPMERDSAMEARRFGQTLSHRMARASLPTHGKRHGPAMPRHRRRRRQPPGGWIPTRATRCSSGSRWRT